MDARMEAVLSGPRVPTLPSVAIRVLELAESPEVNLAQIAEAIEFDQALTARLLRTINSSYYALARPCGSVPQAMSLMGLRAVRSLVLGFTLAKSIDGGGDRDIDFPWRRYWRRVVRCAAAARLIAARVTTVDADEAQVAGLLCEIGMVPLYRLHGDRYLQAMDTAGDDPARLIGEERRAFDLDHAAVGAALAERWGLPPELARAIALHEHDPSETMEPLSRVAASASLAERAIGAESSRSRAAAEASFLRACERLMNLPMTKAMPLLEALAQRAFELAAILEIDIGPAHDPAALVERARSLRDPGACDGTRGVHEADDRSTVDERLAAAFSRADGGGSVTVLVIEPDRVAHARRGRCDDITMSRLEATLAESVGCGGTIHRLSPTLLAAIVEGPGGGAGVSHARRLAERMRRDVVQRRLSTPGSSPLTVSIGVAVHGTQRFESPDSLMRAAMLALSSAQRAGRDCVGFFEPAQDPSTV